MRKNTKKAFGARIVGIVTASNRHNQATWQALDGCDLAEFRADLWEPAQILEETKLFREACIQKFGQPLETIFTLRLKSDGGSWPNERAMDREKIWLALGIDGPNPLCDWMDIEVENIPTLSPQMTSLLQVRKIKLLVSHHNMHATYSPAELNAIGMRLLETKAEGTKLAVFCKERAQVLDLMDFAKVIAKLNQFSCVLSMGAVGKATRVMAPILGCPFTYGYLSEGAVAPGQLSVAQMLAFYSGPSFESLGKLPNADLLDWVEVRIPGDAIAK